MIDRVSTIQKLGGSKVINRISSSLLGPVVPLFRAISGFLMCTVRRHEINKDSLSSKT